MFRNTFLNQSTKPLDWFVFVNICFVFLLQQIVLSVLWFTLQQNQQFTSPLIQISNAYYRLCYSLHSSYNEICAFVQQISPTRIYPIALPNQVTPERFHELLKQFGIDQSSCRSFPPNDIQQQIKQRYQTFESEHDDDEEEEELDFTGDLNQGKNEKNLFERISSLQIILLNKK